MAVALVVSMSAPVLAAKPSGEAGFEQLFDGKTLKGWRGDPAKWSVQDGAITGESNATTPVSTFLIHDGSYGDFELRFKYRISDTGNSGFQFRSAVIDAEKFEVAGYQANVVPPSQEYRFAMLWDHKGRSEIGLLGEKIEISNDNGKLVRNVQSGVNPIRTVLGAYRPNPEWNEYVVVAHGNHIVHVVNGYLALDAVDNDPKARREGVFALQIEHFGTPMKVQFKDIRVKRLTEAPDLTGRFISAPGPAETTAAIPPRPGRAASTPTTPPQ